LLYYRILRTAGRDFKKEISRVELKKDAIESITKGMGKLFYSIMSNKTHKG